MTPNEKRSLSMSLKSKVRKNASSKFKGVSFCKNKKSKKWRSYIKIKSKLIQLGYYQHEEDAAKAYDKAALEYLGPKAILNFQPVDSVNTNNTVGIATNGLI